MSPRYGISILRRKPRRFLPAREDISRPLSALIRAKK